MNIIKDVFLPERIQSYYLFSKIVIGIEINKTHIIATKARVSGKTSTIETIIEEQIPEEVADSQISATSLALQRIFAKIGSYDEIRTVLASSVVIFKELKLPFVSREQIKMVIAFEIEPLLPFPLRDAAIDFIITRTIPEEKSSEIVVTATQKSHIAQHIHLFEQIGIKPSTIIVDMIALYNLYKQMDATVQLSGGTALINLTTQSTTILFMLNTQLKLVRTLPKGIIALTRHIAQEQQKTPQEIMDYILRFGVETTPDEHSIATEKSITDWWESINFTLTSLSTQLLNREVISKIIFLGRGALIPGLLPFISKKTGIACELLNAEHISNTAHFTLKNKNLVTPINAISASSALLTEMVADYNLIQQEFVAPNNRLLLTQLIMYLVLTLTLFATLITHYYLQTSKLRKEITNSEQEALSQLKENLKTIEEDDTDLEEAITTANAELEVLQKRWFAFSNQSRTSFLQYLFELSKIDHKALGLKVDRLTIDDGFIILKADVKDHEALKILQQSLSQSPLFSAVESPETLQFTIRITLANSNGEQE